METIEIATRLREIIRIFIVFMSEASQSSRNLVDQNMTIAPLTTGKHSLLKL